MEKLVLDNYSLMAQYASNFFNNRDVAEDVVQDTFLLAQIKLDKLIEHPNPEAWLMNSLKNIIGNVYRSRKRILEMFVPYDDAMLATGLPIDPRVEYEGMVDDAELGLLFWIYCDGMSYAEVADKLGISVSACKKRVQRAKIRFRQAMDKYDL